MAIGFRYAGYTRVVERGVQGVDLDVAGDGLVSYATEVKTTVTREILYGEKDANGLNDRAADGYQEIVACLFLRSVLSRWFFADAHILRPGKLTEDRIRPYRNRLLEQQIIPHFDAAVTQHFHGSMRDSQAYLDGVLRELRIGTDD